MVSKLIAFTLLAGAAFADTRAQVNFYYDTACKSYAGTSFSNGNVVGGPAGSKSMLFVTSRGDCIDSAPHDLFCKNSQCNAYDVAPGTYVCKSFKNGVWAQGTC